MRAAVFEGEHGPATRQALEEFDAIVAARAILGRWKELQEAALAIVDRYRTVYGATLTGCAAAAAEMKREITASPLFTRLEPKRQQAALARYFGPGMPLSVDAGTLQSNDFGQSNHSSVTSTRFGPTKSTASRSTA